MNCFTFRVPSDVNLHSDRHHPMKDHSKCMALSSNQFLSQYLDIWFAECGYSNTDINWLSLVLLNSVR